MLNIYIKYRKLNIVINYNYKFYINKINKNYNNIYKK